jgi:HlyD family secretion protein
MMIVASLLLSGCAMVQAPAELPEPLTASGSFSAQDVRLSTDLGGRIASISVKLGDTVRAGEVLVTLDTTPWELELMMAEAAVTTAISELALLKSGPRNEEVTVAQAGLALAQAKSDGAYAAWQNALELIKDPQDLTSRIVEVQAQVALADQGVELAEAQLQPAQVNRDIRSENSVERESAEYQVLAAEHALAAAKADLNAAQTLLDYLKWIRHQPLAYIAQANAAEGQYTISQAEVAVAQAQLQDVVDGPTDQQIAVAEAAVTHAQAEADLLRLKIARCALISPIDGVIIAQSLQVGELAAPAATILRLADLSVVSLEVFVPENRIGLVQLNQTVSVTVDSYADQTFEGRVVKIGNKPEFTPRNVATAEERLNTFYSVEIELENPGGLLKPGMPADTRF